MKSYRKELWFHINRRRDFVNITGTLQNCVEESGIKEGLLLCNAMHITASVFINDDEPGLHRILKNGWKRWLLRSHIRVTGITAMKIMRMLT